MSDIFQEVDEEVRRDKAAEFWKKYQNQILAAAVLIVLASAGFRYWQYERERATQAAGDQFQEALTALEGGKFDEAKAGLDKIASPGAERLSGACANDRRRRRGEPRTRKARSGPSTPFPATPRSIRCCATALACAPRSCAWICPPSSRRAKRR